MAQLDNGWVFVSGSSPQSSPSSPELAPILPFGPPRSLSCHEGLNALIPQDPDPPPPPLTPPANHFTARRAFSPPPRPGLPPRSNSQSTGLLWRSARWMRGDIKSTGLGTMSSEAPAPRSLAPHPSHGTLVPLKFHHLNDQRRYNELAQQIREMSDVRELEMGMAGWDWEEMMEAVPQSLSLLEAVYLKLYQAHPTRLPLSTLRPQRLLSQLLWWVAHQESSSAVAAASRPSNDSLLSPDSTRRSQSTGSSSSNSGSRPGSKRPEPAFQWRVMVPHIRNIMRVISWSLPSAIEGMRKEKEGLEGALEGMGLHGLVNCGQNKLIEVTDAVRIELASHQHQIKGLAGQLDKILMKDPKIESPMTMYLYSISGQGGAPIPSKSSHQRLMKMRANDIRDRMRRNEFTLQILEGALRNPDLESLERILKKRISYDKDILGQFQSLVREPNSCYSLSAEDPVVAQLLVHFKNAYAKLLDLLPVEPESVGSWSAGREDSGLGEEDATPPPSPLSPPPPPPPIQHNLPPTPGQRQRTGRSNKTENSFARTKSGRLLGPVAQLINSKSKRLSTQRNSDSPVRGSHSVELPDLQPLRHRSPSHHNLSSSSQQLTEAEEYMEDPGRGYAYPVREKTEVAKLRAEVARLSGELQQSRRRPKRTNHEWERAGVDVEWGSSTSSDESGLAGVSPAIQAYSSLFAQSRADILRELDRLPELHQAEELQIKIIFTVVVLSFRSVQEKIEKKRAKVWDILGLGANNEVKTTEFETAFYKLLAEQAKTDSGMKNAKEVTSQIWRTLFDFPSLKTCTKFNRFILDCVSAAWNLSAGCGNPRYRLEFESSNFHPDKHLRFHSSSLRSSEIKRYIWPGLVDASHPEISVFKGIVLT